jgi:TetR/AcrR family transcriptional regulator of autoinduction and epiphytic fitness
MQTLDTQLPERHEDRRGDRPAAGTDPHKRRQILDGAGRIFSTLGYDGWSMSYVARVAQVSKATLYVYFQDKEHLFTAICAEKRDRNIAELIALLDFNKPFETVLTEFGSDMLRRLSQSFVVAAHRIVIGVAERMPEIGREFFDAGPKRLALALARLIDHHAEAGRLEVEDSYLAAAQFLELAQTTVFRPRLYGVTTELPSDEEVEKVVGSAVQMFMKTYGAAKGS